MLQKADNQKMSYIPRMHFSLLCSPETFTLNMSITWLRIWAIQHLNSRETQHPVVAQALKSQAVKDTRDTDDKARARTYTSCTNLCSWNHKDTMNTESLKKFLMENCVLQQKNRGKSDPQGAASRRFFFGQGAWNQRFLYSKSNRASMPNFHVTSC